MRDHQRQKVQGTAARRLLNIRMVLLLAALFILGMLLRAEAARAHDIPNQIVVQTFAKPEGDRLEFLIRLPLVMLESAGLPTRGPGYLDLTRIDDRLQMVGSALADQVTVYEDGSPLAPSHIETRISQPSERAFETFERARDHILGPRLPEGTNVFWNQGFFDAYLVYPIHSEQGRFSLDFQLGGGVAPLLTIIVRFVVPDGGIRAFEIHAGSSRLVLDPSWYQAAWTFARLGVAHILEGIDHLLFLVCLVLPFRPHDFWSLVGVVTAFTVAHSITLIASASGVVPAGGWFPPLIETAIAASIVYMALENVARVVLTGPWATGLRGRWLITGAFGLVHGFGFSFALQQELQFAGSHLLLSLLAFNVGVEIGQLIVLTVVLPILVLLARRPVLQRASVLLASLLVAHTAWHWLEARAAELQYVAWPSLDMESLALIIGVILLLALASAAAWLTARQMHRRVRRE
jgi:hypothetical protein